jgi:hypothetical protein
VPCIKRCKNNNVFIFSNTPKWGFFAFLDKILSNGNNVPIFHSVILQQNQLQIFKLQADIGISQLQY